MAIDARINFGKVLVTGLYNDTAVTITLGT